MSRKFLPFTIAKSFKHSYVRHAVADFETCYTDHKHENVRVWAWGYLDYITGEYTEGNNIHSFLDKILCDKYVYDIGFHNTKFDGTFIIPWLFRRGYKFMPNPEFMEKWTAGDDLSGYFTHNITVMGQWFSLTICKQQNATATTPAFVHIWDTLKLFNKKLSEIGQQYSTDTQKIQEGRAFYEQIRPEGHELTERESAYLKADCMVLAQALIQQLQKFGTIYRTQASKAFHFFKESCVDEAGNNNYKQKYEGIQQWTVPERAPGFEDYAGATVRYLPKKVRNALYKSNIEVVDAFEYYIPDFYTWSDIKQAYIGGISYVNPWYIERSIYNKITVIDVNSMYPYCLRTFPVPFGRFTKIDGAPDFEKPGAWIACARVSFKLKNEYNLPCIQIKEKYGREWLRESTDYKKYGEEDKYNEDVIFFTSVDYETFKENYNFTVHKWLYYYYFPNVSNMDGKKFVDYWYHVKQDADKTMKKIKKQFPETYKENPEYIRASLERQEAKIMLNSAYGKHGTKYFLYSKYSVYNPHTESVEYIPETQLGRDPRKEPSHYYCPYAAFVTAYARQMLVRTWNAFEGRALYCDTDSIHFLGEPESIPESVAADVDNSGALGLWKVEDVFVKARYIRSKSYIEVKEDGELNITCAGATPEVKKLMDWDTFRVGFNAWAIAEQRGLDYRDHSKLTPKQYPDGVALEPVNFEIKPQKFR